MLNLESKLIDLNVLSRQGGGGGGGGGFRGWSSL
jgi:hypothetical protein